MLIDEEEPRLIEEAVAGDSIALQQLLLRNFSDLERHIAPRIPSDVQSLFAAEDVLQETFAQAFRDITKYRPHPSGSIFPWLRAIADHRLADAIKKLRRKKQGGGMHRVDMDGQSSSATYLLEVVCQQSGSQSRHLARKEALHAILVHLASLPEDQQRVVKLHYFDGVEVGEIAAQMGRTAGAIRGLLHRAQSKLAVLLGHSSQWISR